MSPTTQEAGGTINVPEIVGDRIIYPPLDDPRWSQGVNLYRWFGGVAMNPWAFICGYCGNQVSSVSGMAGVRGDLRSSTPISEEYVKAAAYICPNCTCITFRDEALGAHPGPLYGDSVEHLPDNVQAIYDEARRSMQASAYTGVIALCRSIISHVAMEEGAPKGTFNQHVEYLDREGYIPKKARGGLDWIRMKGNEAAHDLIVFDEAEATRVMDFTIHMLRNIYDFPAKIPATS